MSSIHIFVCYTPYLDVVPLAKPCVVTSVVWPPEGLGQILRLICYVISLLRVLKGQSYATRRTWERGNCCWHLKLMLACSWGLRTWNSIVKPGHFNLCWYNSKKAHLGSTILRVFRPILQSLTYLQLYIDFSVGKREGQATNLSFLFPSIVMLSSSIHKHWCFFCGYFSWYWGTFNLP